ncbi:MAG: PEP-CTERM sorting domain-containing protein [Pseudomonadota bacterium]
MNRKIIHTLVLAALTTLSIPVQADLSGRDLDGNLSTVEAVYDAVLNVTWLADANYAMTSGYDADGRMAWSDALAWADQLDYFGYTQWRLPAADPDCGHFALDCTLNELGSLYYLGLGGEAAGNLLTTHNADFELFTNIETASGGVGTYFTADENAGTPNAWAFAMQTGYQRLISKSGANYAWAVHDGDIGVPTTPIPEPETYVLMMGGLALLAWKTRRRRLPRS